MDSSGILLLTITDDHRQQRKEELAQFREELHAIRQRFRQVKLDDLRESYKMQQLRELDEKEDDEIEAYIAERRPKPYISPSMAKMYPNILPSKNRNTTQGPQKSTSNSDSLQNKPEGATPGSGSKGSSVQQFLAESLMGVASWAGVTAATAPQKDGTRAPSDKYHLKGQVRLGGTVLANRCAHPGL